MALQTLTWPPHTPPKGLGGARVLPAKTPLPGKGPRSLQEGGEGGPGGISAGTPSPRRSQLCQDGAWVMLAQGVQPHLLYLATCHLCSLPRKPPEASAPAFALPTYRNCPQPATSTFHDAKCDASHWPLSGPSSAQPPPPPPRPLSTAVPRHPSSVPLAAGGKPAARGRVRPGARQSAAPPGLVLGPAASASPGTQTWECRSAKTLPWTGQVPLYLNRAPVRLGYML